ncbi:GNAT family N-acetyltransferase [Rickettsia endosymbiont of Halotydeus destructor]|uniref:GNAT family N-acetyltransferase n=1 Tax=Rickettsia endosymbiont of Halotydeus destructor TaxID=2996754 RepID=UPI003BB0EBFF
MKEDLITKLKIQELSFSDIDLLVSSFAKARWHKPKEIFERYLQEQQQDKRLIWLAYLNDQITGYVTLVWKSQYEYFNKKKIPEIKDLNVLPVFRNLGIGFKLLKTAEKAAFAVSDTIGIGVGLYADYGVAQKLYIKNGYIPDARGIAYNNQTLQFGTNIILDDDLVLFFTKKML